MKFIKKLAGDMKTNWDNLNEEQKLNTFALMWEGQQIPNNRLINKIKNKLPGLRYKEIYSQISNVIEKQEPKEIERLAKDLEDFYGRPITPEQKAYYPLYNFQIREKLFPVDSTWLTERILPDLKECEQIQKQRMMKRYGLLK